MSKALLLQLSLSDGSRYIPIKKKGELDNKASVTTISSDGTIALSPDTQYFNFSTSVYNQDWYWTDEWQRMEAEVEESLRQGHYRKFSSMEDLLLDLKSQEDENDEWN